MVLVAEPLAFLWHVCFAIEKGQSLRSALQEYLHDSSTVFQRQVRSWWQQKEKGEDTARWLQQLNNPYRLALFTILERGWAGDPILPSLNELEKEFLQVSDNDLACHLQRLPVLGLFPLLLFQFPSFMALLLGPLLTQLLGRLGGV